MPRPAKHAASSATVHIHVRDLAQMFNSLDASPFWDRDLDRGAAAFIEEEFRERPSAQTWHLNVHTQSGQADVDSLQTALTSYYERLANSARIELRDQLRTSQLALLGGLALFALLMSAREILLAAMTGLPTVLDEGLIILAWLTLWRPAESLAYEWVPLHRRRRLYERLSRIRVALRWSDQTVARQHTKTKPAGTEFHTQPA